MRVKLITIRSPRWVRLPYQLWQACGVSEAIDLRADDRRIIVTPRTIKPRQN
jgi:hypothetical protein